MTDSLDEMDNPFEKELHPNCPEREAGYNRGCYSGFEKARTIFKLNIEEAKREERERVDKQWCVGLYEVLDRHPFNRDLIHKKEIAKVIEIALKGGSK